MRRRQDRGRQLKRSGRRPKEADVQRSRGNQGFIRADGYVEQSGRAGMSGRMLGIIAVVLPSP